MASIAKRPDGRWRARYRDAAGKEHAKHFRRKVDAQGWLDQETAKLVTGMWVAPTKQKLTVGEWCDTWLEGYGTRRRGTVRQAKTHIVVIKKTFADQRLADVKPSAVKAWTAQLQETYAPSTTYAIYRRLAQILGDAVHDGLLPRSPCSRRTSPGQAKPRPYVASTAQVWAVHDAFPAHLRPAVLLGAFAGLRVAEAAALRVVDVDFMRGVISPAIQYPAEPLKSDTAKTPIPVPDELALQLAAAVEASGGSTIVTDVFGKPTTPWAIERAMRAARDQVQPDGKRGVEKLPDGFRFHDLRHYFASLLIAAGLDVKVVQTRLRHASATTTLNTYGHMFPDKDKSAREAIAAAFASRADSLRTRPSQTSG